MNIRKNLLIFVSIITMFFVMLQPTFALESFIRSYQYLYDKYSVTWTYRADSHGAYGVGVSGITGEVEYLLTGYVDVTINLNNYSTGYIILNHTNTGFIPDILAVNAKVTTNNNSSTRLDFVNTNTIVLTYSFSMSEAKTLIGSTTDVLATKWINDAHNYFNINGGGASFSPSNFDSDYTDVLNQISQRLLDTNAYNVTYLQTINGTIQGLGSYIDGVEGTLNQINSKIGTLNTSMGTLNSYVDGVETSLSTLITNTNQIKAYIDGVETLISTTNGKIDNIVQYIDGVEGHLTNVHNDLYGINQRLQSILDNLNTSSGNDIATLNDYKYDAPQRIVSSNISFSDNLSTGYSTYTYNRDGNYGKFLKLSMNGYYMNGDNYYLLYTKLSTTNSYTFKPVSAYTTINFDTSCVIPYGSNYLNNGLMFLYDGSINTSSYITFIFELSNRFGQPSGYTLTNIADMELYVIPKISVLGEYISSLYNVNRLNGVIDAVKNISLNIDGATINTNINLNPMLDKQSETNLLLNSILNAINYIDVNINQNINQTITDINNYDTTINNNMPSLNGLPSLNFDNIFDYQMGNHLDSISDTLINVNQSVINPVYTNLIQPLHLDIFIFIGLGFGIVMAIRRLFK